MRGLETLAPAAGGDGCCCAAPTDDEEEEVGRRLHGPGGRNLRHSQASMSWEAAAQHPIEQQQGSRAVGTFILDSPYKVRSSLPRVDSMSDVRARLHFYSGSDG
jgi:hypothetical protein